jgi:ClpP class serine protease
MQQDIGIEEIEIVSTSSPKKRPEPTKEDGRAQIQVWADDLAHIFIRNVAEFRGVDSTKVMSDFGQGDIMIASKALSVGMIDELGTFEALIKSLEKGEKNMLFDNGKTTAVTTEPSAVAEGVMTVENLQASHPALYAAVFATSATAERERIQLIAQIAEPSYASLIEQHMFDGESTVNDVKVAIFDAKNEAATKRKNSFVAGGQATAEALAEIKTAHNEGAGSDKKTNRLVQLAQERNKR